MGTPSAAADSRMRAGAVRRRRLARRLGALLCVAGALGAAWVVTVWRWQDPFTALYSLYHQQRLAESYDDRAARFADLAPVAVDPAAVRRELLLAARQYRRESAVGDAVGRLDLHRIGVERIVVNGSDSVSLRRGPGRDVRTFMPGEGQLVYVAGHRTTYGAPFARIDSLRPGDGVTLELPYATFEYSVVRHVVVSANDISRLRSNGREILALQACHPRFFATQRYIVYARPTRVRFPNGRSIPWTPELDARARLRDYIPAGDAGGREGRSVASWPPPIQLLDSSRPGRALPRWRPRSRPAAQAIFSRRPSAVEAASSLRA